VVGGIIGTVQRKRLRAVPSSQIPRRDSGYAKVGSALKRADLDGRTYIISKSQVLAIRTYLRRMVTPPPMAS
jgi:hypothetical protein